MNTLYQFSISHYCEKVRWAMDVKQIEYTIKNLIPGPHISQVKKLAKRTELPLLHIEKQFIQGSENIIDYLDENFPDNQITPSDEIEKRDADLWETFADEKLGVPIRNIIYHDIINKPEIIIPMWTQSGPIYGTLFYKLFFSKVQKVTISALKINDEVYEKNKIVVSDAIKEIDDHLSDKKFLVGDKLTRADISVCALLAPLLAPENSYFNQYLPYPEEIEAFRATFANSYTRIWVDNLYKNHRH